MPRENYKLQSGVTLVELLIVIVVIGIVSSIAMMQLRTPKNQLSRQNVARELKVAFERARFDSVKRRVATNAEMAKVTVSATAFTLTTDVNLNGTLESSDDSINNFSNQDVTITNTTGNAMVFPVTITYNKRGEPIAKDANNVTVSPIFLICNGTCNSNNATSSNANIVLVTATGTVNLLPGNGAVPTFATPNVTTVPGNANISNLAVVN